MAFKPIDMKMCDLKCIRFVLMHRHHSPLLFICVAAILLALVYWYSKSSIALHFDDGGNKNRADGRKFEYNLISNEVNAKRLLIY